MNYVGHRFTKDGLKLSETRIKAIVEMKEPENHAELESVLGMIAYVAKFIPNLSQMNAPLREAKVSKTWLWGPSQQNAYKEIKAALSSAPVLRYFDVNQPVLLSVDASMKGLGAALIQNGDIVAYASRAITPEQRYAQIEKEMLAVVFGCTRMHKLIYGVKELVIESDHKPLENLLKKPIHAAPMRIQRMILKLQPYTFTLVYKKGKDIGLADCLSRLPQENDNVDDETIDSELMVCVANTLASCKHATIAEATQKDRELHIVRELIINGWPEHKRQVPDEASPYWDYRDEMSTYNGIVYRGERLCIPKLLREDILKTLHTAHMGIVKTKHLARDIVFWPGMSKRIDEMVSKCPVCLENRDKNAKEPLNSHPVPDTMEQSW